MNKIIVFILFLTFAFSCKAQSEDLKLRLKEFESKEAGLKASLPCEPEKFFKSFQDRPRPIHVYDFDCETGGIKFVISSKNYMNEFNEKTLAQTFASHENILKNFFGEVESFNEKKDFLVSGLKSGYYEVRLQAGGKINELVAASNVRYYVATVGVMPQNVKKLKESKLDYDSVSKKFINSFQVIDK